MLQEVFRDVMKRSRDRIDPVRAGFGRIEKEKINAVAVMRTVRRRITRNKKCTFRSLLAGGRGRSYVVVTFITILELMRLGVVDAVQEETFGEIYIMSKDENKWNEIDEITDIEAVTDYAVSVCMRPVTEAVSRIGEIP